MRLEFIKNINGYDEHAIRLSDFNSSQAVMFFGIINRMVRHSDSPIDLSSLGFIHPVNCNLILRSSADDAGISTADNVNFFCDLTAKTYKTIEGLVEPFCRKESKGYQWLYDIDTPIGFLFSSGKDMPAEK
ncbi:MAG: hypothetical protein HY063_15090 [Bacteroidetes bacterium]|nr:hypothetical protein [Bacteroidota bacterium]